MADATRRTILARLAAGPATVSDVAAPHAVSLPAISKHLRVLEEAGLIQREKAGRTHWLRLRPEPFRDAAEWLSFYQRFWDGQLDRLADFLESKSNKENS